MKKRIVSALIVISMIISMAPVSAEDQMSSENDVIKQMLFESVDSEIYPDGVFDFLTPQMTVSEDMEYVEFAVVRRGNTQSQASVMFRAIDVSAKYGEDYYITVSESSSQDKLAMPEEAMTFVEMNMPGEDEVQVMTLGGALESENPEEVSAFQSSSQGVDSEEALSSETEEKEILIEKEQNTGDTLRSAEALIKGTSVNTSNWRIKAEAENEEDPGIEEFQSGYQNLYAQLPAAEYRFTFEAGEYIKYLRFYCINDDVSEDDELVLFTLTDAEGCALTDNPSGYVNIQDDEEKEKIIYTFAEKQVMVSPEENSAVITVQRISGINRYGSVEIGTAADSAEPGEYYEPFMTELIFVPGQEFQKIEISIKKHPSNEAVRFTVNIPDGDGSAVIIEPKAPLAKAETQTVLLSSEAPMPNALSARAVDRWTRTYTLKTAPNKLQVTNYDSTATEVHNNQDLSMVGKISFDSISYSNGTYWRKKFLWFTTSSGYYRDYASFLKIGGREVWSKSGFYGAWRIGDTYTLTDADRKETQLTFGFKTWGNTKDAMGEFGTERYYYLPIEVILPDPSATDTDANISVKTWTSSTKSTTSETVYAGKMAFQGGGETITNGSKKFFYNDDTVSLVPSYNSELEDYEKNNIYLWGFKIERKPGSSTPYYYVPGTSFKIKDLFTGKLQGYTQDPAGGNIKKVTVDTATTRMTDSSEGETYYAYRIYPVYRQKKAYVKITADDSKSAFAAGTFKNNETIAIGILDSIKISLAGKGEYGVSGYSYYGQTAGGTKETTSDTERSLYLENVSSGDKKICDNSPYYKNTSNWPTRTILNAGVQNPGEYIFSPTQLEYNETTKRDEPKWTPRGENHLVVLYEKPEISVTVNPRASNTYDQSAGQIAYIDPDTQESQLSSFTGTYQNADGEILNYGTNISVSPFMPGKTYQFFSIYNAEAGEEDQALRNKYRVVWSDMTGDLDRNGILSKEEVKALGTRYNLMTSESVIGNVLNYTPAFGGSHVIYWNFEPKPENQTEIKQKIHGYVSVKSNTVIDNTKGKPKSEKGISGVQVRVGDLSAITDEEGYFSIESEDFRVGEKYSITATYAGKVYTGTASVNYIMNDFVIDEYATFNVYDFAAYRLENKSEYENTYDWQSSEIPSSNISNEDARHLYQFRISSNNSSYAVSKAVINRYNKQGMLQKSYTAVYDPKTNLYTVKEDGLISENYSLNPASENISAGDYLTIVVYDQNNVADIEHKVGFSYKKALDTLGVINSFNTPFNGVIEFIGAADIVFDLGVNTKLNSLLAENGEITETEDPETGVMTRTIKLGFSKNFKKDYDSDKNEEGNEEKSNKSEGDILKESAKSESTTDEQFAKTSKDAVDKNSGKEETKKKSKVTANFTVDLSIAFELTMEAQATGDHSYDYYFKDFVVTGVVSGSAGTKYSYTTPIGITLFITGELSGDITAIVAFEQYNDKRFYFTDSSGSGEESGQIDLTNAGNTDVNRDFNVYGKLLVNPKISLGLGASYGSIASVSLVGSAQFNMVFTSAVTGSGKVNLSGELVLELLDGLVTKKWLLGQYSYDLFEYNNGAELMSLNLFGDDDYRYDTLTYTGRDTSYLKNRGEWNESGGVSLMSVGADQSNIQTLLTGAYPGAYPLIENIDTSDFGSNKQILFFLDDEGTGNAVLKYSIYNGSYWSKPQNVDEDLTNDDTPITYDLGDKILIMWSSADEQLNEDMKVDDILNSRNIKARFFDKETASFGEITCVTKTTEADFAADSSPSASYTVIDGKEYLMVTYAKEKYEVTGEDMSVGDAINPYTTVAYRFYDFETETWTEDYADEVAVRLLNTLTEEQFNTFSGNWYGQGFIDLSQYAVVDESSILLGDESQYKGLWSRDPLPDEISFAQSNLNMIILENEGIGYDKYSVSAYVVDMDGDRATTYDTEIFLQLYDFTTENFLTPIRLTDDSSAQSYVTLKNTPAGISLYYISGGDIVEYDISKLINSGLLYTSVESSSEVVLLNKNYKVYQTPSVIVKCDDEDKPISEFVVNSDGNNMFLMWTELETTFKDGIDKYSAEATNPENQFSERQIYIQMASYNQHEQLYYDEDGQLITYPDTIDWTEVPDINGEIGKVSAGEPVVEYTKTAEWTNWVQLTDEKGANFNDIDCRIVSDGVLRIVFLKGISELTEIDGTLMPAVNSKKLQLQTMDVNLSYASFTQAFDEVTLNNAEANAEVLVPVNIRNESILRMDYIVASLYMQKDGEEIIKIGESESISLKGGEEGQVVINWNTPEQLSGITLYAKISQGGYAEEGWQCTYSYGEKVDQLQITNAEVTLNDRYTAVVSAEVFNIGNDTVTDGIVYVDVSGKIVKSDPIYLNRGDTTFVDIIVPLTEDCFESEISESGDIKETASISVITDISVHDLKLSRTADKVQADLMENIKGVSLINAETMEQLPKINLAVGELLMTDIKTAFNNENMAAEPAFTIISSDPDVVQIQNCVAEGIAAGQTELHVYIYPPAFKSEADEKGVFNTLDPYAETPMSLIKEITIPVTVTEDSERYPDEGAIFTQYYTVTFNTVGGSIVGSVTAIKNETIDRPADPVKDGYIFEGWYMDEKYTYKYDFSNGITESITLYAKWTEIPSAEEVWENPFRDVEESDWFYGDVRYVYENGIFSGVSNTEFSPNSTLTRAMLVTALYRCEDCPNTDKSDISFKFKDVDSESWYADAVYWAWSNGIVKGYSEEDFCPEKEISREEIAAVLERYANFKGKVFDEEASLSAFSDADQISDWAYDNIRWAVGAGVLKGRDDGSLDPKGSVMRAEAAALIHRFLCI